MVLKEEPMPTCAARTTSLTKKLEIYRAVSTRYHEWYAHLEGGGRCFHWSLMAFKGLAKFQGEIHEDHCISL